MTWCSFPQGSRCVKVGWFVMRAVVQRVSQARVLIDGAVVGQIERGLLILLGVTQTDTVEQARWLADKIVGLRIFNDAEGKMNLSVADVGGAILIVSQFTLYGDCRKGRRPGFTDSAPAIQNACSASSVGRYSSARVVSVAVAYSPTIAARYGGWLRLR